MKTCAHCRKGYDETAIVDKAVCSSCGKPLPESRTCPEALRLCTCAGVIWGLSLGLAVVMLLLFGISLDDWGRLAFSLRGLLTGVFFAVISAGTGYCIKALFRGLAVIVETNYRNLCLKENNE